MTAGKTVCPPRAAMLLAAGLAAGLTGMSLPDARAQDLTQPGVRAGGVIQAPADEAARPLPAPQDDASRVRKMEHRGLRLGQSDEAVRAVLPDLELTPVHGTQAQEVVRYYTAELVTEGELKLSLRFDREKRMYKLESVQVLRPGVTATSLRQRVESKYGPADVAGQMGLGVYRIGYADPRAALNVFADIALAGRDAPSVIRVELVDHALESANEAAFRVESQAKGGEPGPPPVGDTRVKL